MYQLLFGFLTLFPFLIYPWGKDPYYTNPKFIYLLVFTMLVWVFFLVGLIRNKRTGRRRMLDLKAGEWLAMLFLLLVVISTIFSVDRQMSLMGTVMRWEGLPAFVAYVTLFIASYRLIRHDRLPAMLNTLVYGSFLAAIYGALQHLHLDFLPRYSDKAEWTRSYSFFDNPNFLGSYLVLMLCLVLALYLREHFLGKQLVYSVIACTLFGVLIYTDTRGTWLGALAGWAVFTIAIAWKHRTLVTKWVVISCALLAVFFAINLSEGGVYLSRAGSIAGEMGKVVAGGEVSGTAGTGRWEQWTNSASLIDDYWLTGSGPDTLELVYPHVPGRSAMVDKAHNEYLQIAVTLGVPALMVYLLLVLVSWLAGVRQALSYGSNSLLALGLVAAVSGYLVQATFNISVIPVAPFFWSLLGMTYGLAARPRSIFLD